MGYHRAGFDVTGVDNRPMPRFPFQFVQADALDYLAAHGREFDAIHASPPCQRYSTATQRSEWKDRHPDLVGPTREALCDISRPWVIENVNTAPISRGAAQLCGLMFGLKVFRHRWFEASFLLLSPPHPSHKKKRIGADGFCCVVGHGGQDQYANGRPQPRWYGSMEAWSAAMGIDWMDRRGLAQAIPPAYTEFVGRQLMEVVTR